MWNSVPGVSSITRPSANAAEYEAVKEYVIPANEQNLDRLEAVVKAP